MRSLEQEGRSTSIKISVAALWALCSAQFHYYKVVLHPEPATPHYKQIYQTFPCYQGPIFGRARWDLWHKKMAQVCEDEKNIDDEARELGRKAADLMASLSRNVQF